MSPPVPSTNPPVPTVNPPVSSTNACLMCMPLGACLAFAGVQATVPFLHGSQGCATYIRRYLISHFNEPFDVASSSFGEASTVFGGEPNLREGLANVRQVYAPGLVGVATTCLTETIGEDVGSMLRRLAPDGDDGDDGDDGEGAAPTLVHAPTPSYAGTHADGYQAAVAAVVDALAEAGPATDAVAVLPGIVSTADLRHLRELAAGHGLDATLLPDYSGRLDAPIAAAYQRLPDGGTALAEIAALGGARAAVQLGGLAMPGTRLAAEVLADRFGVPARVLPLPVGVRLTDRLCALLAELAGDRPAAGWIAAERGRLIDAYVDGHKYLAGRRALVYGDEDLVVGLAAFLSEIGVHPAVCASGGRSGRLEQALAEAAPELAGRVEVLPDADFDRIGAAAERVRPDLLIGHSRGYHLARRLGIPLIRVGLPIHDRIGGQRLQHLGYQGAQRLFDQIVNTVIQQQQDGSPVGYSYL